MKNKGTLSTYPYRHTYDFCSDSLFVLFFLRKVDLLVGIVLNVLQEATLRIQLGLCIFCVYAGFCVFNVVKFLISVRDLFANLCDLCDLDAASNCFNSIIDAGSSSSRRR